MSLDFSELPEETRVKLTEDGRDDLWHRVDEFGGVKQLSEAFDFSASNMYNWRNKNSYLPIKFVKRLMGENPSKIESIKGSGRGKSWKTSFPIPENNELLTRIKASVKVSEEGIPFYITNEKSLANRFQELLDEYSIPHKNYSRDRYEIRYPKFVHSVLSQMTYEEDLSALVDEKGSIEDEKIIVESRQISVNEFSGQLHSRERKLELAVASEDSETISELISEESSKVRRLLQN